MRNYPIPVLLAALTSVSATPSMAAAWGTGEEFGAVRLGFAPGVDASYVAAMYSALPPQPEFFTTQQWGVQGAQTVVTWSLIPDGLSIPGFVGGPEASDLFAQMDAKFAAQGGRATWIARVESCFERWEELCGIDFVRVTAAGVDWDDGAMFGSPGNGVTVGDIRIAMRSVDGPLGVVDYAFSPLVGDIVMDRTENWADASNLHRFLRNALMQKIAFGSGMLPMCSLNSQQLCQNFLNLSFDGPRQDDIRGMQRLYGDVNEADNTSSSATPVILTSGVALDLGPPQPPATGTNDLHASSLSIDENGDVDWFTFSVAQPAALDVVLTPIGSTYSHAPSSGGACGAASNVVARSMYDLACEVLAPDGVTVLALADSVAIGLPETLTDVLLTAPGTYFVRVFELSGPSSTQLYHLQLRIDSCSDSDADGLDDCIDNCPSLSNPSQADCDNDGVGDACELAAATQFDLNGNGVPDACDPCPNIINYCSAGTSGAGCVPSISTSGAPSIAAPAGFNINVTGVEGQRSGLLFYGVDGPRSPIAWAVGSSSFQCVKSPVQRTGLQGSGGGTGQCNGAFSLDILAYWQAHPSALGQPIAANRLINLQAWYRDPSSPGATSLSGALQFMTCP